MVVITISSISLSGIGQEFGCDGESRRPLKEDRGSWDPRFSLTGDLDRIRGFVGLHAVVDVSEEQRDDPEGEGGEVVEDVSRREKTKEEVDGEVGLNPTEIEDGEDIFPYSHVVHLPSLSESLSESYYPYRL